MTKLNISCCYIPQHVHNFHGYLTSHNLLTLHCSVVHICQDTLFSKCLLSELSNSQPTQNCCNNTILCDSRIVLPGRHKPARIPLGFASGSAGSTDCKSSTAMTVLTQVSRGRGLGLAWLDAYSQRRHTAHVTRPVRLSYCT